MENEKMYWSACPECKGEGKKKQRIRKKARLRYEAALNNFEKTKQEGTAPIPPKIHFNSCINCNGSGLINTTEAPVIDTVNYPHVAIIGGGIGGVALAVACLHRGIPFTLFERDLSFDARSQGYGLTLQQASNAMKGLGITALKKGITSTKHIVHTTDGKVIGEWGMRKWVASDAKKNSKRTNVHIARQALRLELLEQLGATPIQWGHQLIDYKTTVNKDVELRFNVNGKIKNITATLVVGADGIRSTVRNFLIGENKTPLRYLGCIVILGICPLSALKDIQSPLLDSATVFQTANGNERMYMMPFDADTIMWQLSFSMTEEEAKFLSNKGSEALKKEACLRTKWHSPIPEIVNTTAIAQISGYPVYDRALLTPELLKKEPQITLIGDAAHPMSPFKGQGANQALLDALALARGIAKECRPLSDWRKVGIRQSVLNVFEMAMLTRSAKKVKGSAEAVKFLHSDIVLREGNSPRGRKLNEEETE